MPSDDLKFKYDQYEQDLNDKKEEKDDKVINTSKIRQDNLIKQGKQESQNRYDEDFQEAKTTSQRRSANSVVKVSKSRSPDREKMIQQNIKLKTQIYELAKQMDEIIQKQKQQKKYGIHAQEEDNESLRDKKTQLKRQQVQIMNLKNKIFLTKRQLEYVYDSRGIQTKEDQLKNLQIQLKQLQEEKVALVRVKKQQMKALKQIRHDHQYEQKIKHLKQQLSSLKEDCKHLSDQLQENERVLRKNHEIYVTKQTKIKEMEGRIKENRQRARKSVINENIVTVEMIEEIDSRIVELERERKQSEKIWNDKIQAIELQLQQKRIEEEKKLLILKQKEKQLKLNEIRIKELKKLIQHHNYPAPKKQTEQSSDMKQFRHKRNIKYLEKGVMDIYYNY